VTRTLRSTGAQAYGIAVACLIRTLDNTFVQYSDMTSTLSLLAFQLARRRSNTVAAHGRMIGTLAYFLRVVQSSHH
jgi:hypothetical protein